MSLEEIKTLSEDLKEAMPSLLSAKKLLQGIPIIQDQVKDLKEQIENIDGTVLEMGKKVVEIGNRKIKVLPSGLSNEEKLDFARFFIAIAKSKKDPSSSEKREVIVKLQEKYGVDVKTALNEGTDGQGGYLVPEAFSDVIWRVTGQSSIILKDAFNTPLTPGYKMPLMNLATSVAISWVDEAGAVGQSEPTFGKTTVDAKKMMAYSLISNELLEDEEIGIVDLLVTLFGEKIAEEIDSQGFVGDGTVFTGALNASGINAVTMAIGTGFTNVDFDDISDAISLIKASVIAGAKFYMHRTVLNVIRKLKDSENNYIWSPPVGSTPAQIWGYPYELPEAMPAVSASAAATPFILFGSLKYYQVGTKGEMTVKIADELKMLTDQTVLAVRKRIAMATALAEALAVIKTGAAS